MKVLLLILLLATPAYAQTTFQSFGRARVHTVTPSTSKWQAYKVRGKIRYSPRMSQDMLNILSAYGKVKKPRRYARTQGRETSAEWAKRHTPKSTYWNYRKADFDRPKKEKK